MVGIKIYTLGKNPMKNHGKTLILKDNFFWLHGNLFFLIQTTTET